MKYELNMEWTQARINEAAARGDYETMRSLTADWDRRVQWNRTEDWLNAALQTLKVKA